MNYYAIKLLEASTRLQVKKNNKALLIEDMKTKKKIFVIVEEIFQLTSTFCITRHPYI